MNQKTKWIKLVLLALVAVCFFVFIASALASGLDMGHECTGDNCLICMAISLRERVSSLLVLLASALSIFAFVATTVRIDAPASRLLPVLATPVCLKVKLSD